MAMVDFYQSHAEAFRAVLLSSLQEPSKWERGENLCPEHWTVAIHKPTGLRVHIPKRFTKPVAEVFTTGPGHSLQKVTALVRRDAEAIRTLLEHKAQEDFRFNF